MDFDRMEDVLEEYGLSPYQANAFLTLLELRDASVSEINEASNVPQPRIYDVLETLDEKGFVETYKHESLRARIVNPVDFTSRLEQRADRFRESASLIQEYWQMPPLEKHTFEIYGDFQTILEHSAKDVGSAEESIHLAISASDFLRMQDALETAVSNDVIVNVSIYVSENSETSVEDLEPFLREAASEARYRENHAPFLALVDSHKAYFGVRRLREGYGMYVQDQALSTMLYRYFQDTLWKRWDVVHERHTGTFPKEFASIRRCLTELRSYFDGDDALRASVDGYDTETGREMRVEGTIVDIHPMADSGIGIEEADQVCLSVDSDSETYTVGGFGAIVEDVRATRIRVSESGSIDETEDANGI